MRFLLQFATPFKVGDTVYLAYPPNQKAVTGSIREIYPLKATICTINVSFGLVQALTVREPLEEYELKVEQVTYTLAPFSPDQFSPFTLRCPADEATPTLFATEEEFTQQQMASVE